MEVSVPTLLLLLWLKTLLNWAVVLIHWPHVVRTFSGFFSISLALFDTFLDIVVTHIFLREDFYVSDVRFTQYHICLLVQIAGFVYSVLHWPTFLLIGFDSYWTSSTVFWPRKLTYVCGTLLLWVLAMLHVLWRPDFSPVTDDSHHLLDHCKVSSRSQSSQVAAVLLLAVAGVAVYTNVSEENWRNAHLRRSMFSFLSTWSSFLVLLVALLAFQMEIPAYLDMNVPWLCLLHSFHITLTLNSCSCLLCGQKEEALKDKISQTAAFCLWTH